MGISEQQSLEYKQDVKHDYNMRWETFYGMKFLIILGGKLWLWTYH
ncbi:hypothetical protein SLEP1_g38223 [Rubroshorea leprosula]|uniref:Uncharacterized protein n=1 Tax=Rubroshorea leprosula TaxID=152421 RepID=A0AAV5KX65_9ROSI|nr:hypothetical protein SLEP1_g38223 [Rubroshorea leprosula]